MSKRRFILVRIDENYCDYLREYDSRVIFNADDKALRPFIGVMFSVNGLDYFAPLTSPKPDFDDRNNSPIFQKIAGGHLGAIRLSSMIPVPTSLVKPINLSQECLTRAEFNYQNLLKKQFRWMKNNSEKIEKKAQRLYLTYKDGSLKPYFAQFCCNFPLLEDKCREFMRLNQIGMDSINDRLASAVARAGAHGESIDGRTMKKFEKTM